MIVKINYPKINQEVMDNLNGTEAVSEGEAVMKSPHEEKPGPDGSVSSTNLQRKAYQCSSNSPINRKGTNITEVFI